MNFTGQIPEHALEAFRHSATIGFGAEATGRWRKYLVSSFMSSSFVLVSLTHKKITDMQVLSHRSSVFVLDKALLTRKRLMHFSKSLQGRYARTVRTFRNNPRPQSSCQVVFRSRSSATKLSHPQKCFLLPLVYIPATSSRTLGRHRQKHTHHRRALHLPAKIVHRLVRPLQGRMLRPLVPPAHRQVTSNSTTGLVPPSSNLPISPRPQTMIVRNLTRFSCDQNRRHLHFLVRTRAASSPITDRNWRLNRTHISLQVQTVAFSSLTKHR